MNKPRPSILELFDPLKTPAGPKALRASVGDSPDSDKENSTPDRYSWGKELTLTAFFDRTLPAQMHASPVKFRRRLVDVGDATVDFSDMMQARGAIREFEDVFASVGVHSDSDEEESQGTGPEFPVTPRRIAISQPSTPRTPLADLTRHFDSSLHKGSHDYFKVVHPLLKGPAEARNTCNKVARDTEHAAMRSGHATVGLRQALEALVIDAAEKSADVTTSKLAVSQPSLTSSTNLSLSSSQALLTAGSLPHSASSRNSFASLLVSDTPAVDSSSDTSLRIDLVGSEASFDLLNDRMELEPEANDFDSFSRVAQTGHCDELLKRGIESTHLTTNSAEDRAPSLPDRNLSISETLDTAPTTARRVMRGAVENAPTKEDADTTEMEERFACMRVQDGPQVSVQPAFDLPPTSRVNAGPKSNGVKLQAERVSPKPKTNFLRNDSFTAAPLASEAALSPQPTSHDPVFTRPRVPKLQRPRPIVPSLVPISGLRIVKRSQLNTAGPPARGISALSASSSSGALTSGSGKSGPDAVLPQPKANPFQAQRLTAVSVPAPSVLPPPPVGIPGSQVCAAPRKPTRSGGPQRVPLHTERLVPGPASQGVAYIKPATKLRTAGGSGSSGRSTLPRLAPPSSKIDNFVAITSSVHDGLPRRVLR